MSDKDNQNFVERFTIRMPDGMRDAIAERAKTNGRSMNSEIIQILEDALRRGSDLSKKMDEISFVNADDDRVKGLPVEAAFSDYIDRRTDEFKAKIIQDILYLIK